ncbi:MAG: hypothetical protein JNK58_11185, partial [Phycisphaerae bacterium]|nr:hypothetical protein [Phycisphaerae bacterium]
MPGRPGPSSLRLPLLMSVLLHAAAGALGARWSFDRDRLEREARDRDPAALPPEDPPGIEPEPEPIQLGLADSRATSLTWLGFDKFEEQFAAASEVDQPELTMDPSAGPVTESLAVAMADAAAPTPESSPPSPAPAPEAAPAVDAMPHESEATTPEPAPQAERALPPPPAGEGPIEEPGDEAAVKPVDADETRKVAEETKNPEEPRSDPPTEEVVVVPPAAPRV